MAAPILAAPRWVSTKLSGTGVPILDFTRYDAYIDDLPFLYHRGEGSSEATVSLPLRPQRTDQGDNRFEMRPEFGDPFSQGDFSGGALQEYFHRPTRDEASFFTSEGFDISEQGVLRHLNSTLEDGNYTSPTALVQAGGLPFFAHSNDVVRGDGAFPGAYFNENPHVAEGAVAVLDLAAQGAKVFAALGANGVHVRSSGGTWSHFQPDGSTNLSVGNATRVEWVKDRLMVVGNGGDKIHEIAASSTPPAIETLAEGWTFEHVFESGPFVMACTVNTNAGRSRVHAYKLNTAGTALEKKTSTPLPKGEFAYCGISYLGRTFVAGGRQNSSGGYDAILYEGLVDVDGNLALQLIAADATAAANDYSIREMESLRSAISFGWVTSTRTGLGIFHLARNAFAQHIVASGAARTTSVMSFKGRLLFTNSTGLFFERLATPVTSANLVTSIADWNNAGFKTWDLFQIVHDSLDTLTTVEIQYTIAHPDAGEWLSALISSITGSTGREVRVEDLRSRIFAVKIISVASGIMSPKIRSYSVRAMPSPERTEWQLTRSIRLLSDDRKDINAEKIYMAPRAMLSTLRALAYRWVTIYEPDATYVGWVEAVADQPLNNVINAETLGSAEREGYVVEIRFIAREA